MRVLPAISDAAPRRLLPAVSDVAGARRKQRAKVYGLRTFMEPGTPMNFPSAFADNVRRFVRECGEVEDGATRGMPTWSTMLVDDKGGCVVRLYTVEEPVRCSPRPFCDYCRCTGWSHHLVSIRRYHFIIPADKDWNRALSPNALYLRNHLLHGLIHCNGFGHLICINGREGGSSFVSGGDLMHLWDRICTSLRAREITVEDTSSNKSMELRLLLGVAYGTTWFGRWGYEYCMGSYGVTRDAYDRAIDLLSSLNIDALISDHARFGRDKGELRRVVATYRKLCYSDPAGPGTPLVTVRGLLRYLLDLSRRAPRPAPCRQLAATKPRPPPPPMQQQQMMMMMPKKRTEGVGQKRKRDCREFAQVAAELGSRWPLRRLQVAAEVIVERLREHGGMTRQEIRDSARLVIGDTGLLDFVLKSLGNCLVGGHLVRRSPNPSTRVLEFSIDEVLQDNHHPAGTPVVDDRVLSLYPEETEEEEVAAEDEPEPSSAASPNPGQLERDIARVYRGLVAGRPESTQTVLDSKRWAKKWGLSWDEEDDRLRFLCMWMPGEREMEELTRALPPPMMVVVEPYAAVGDLRKEAERAMRDTYCILNEVQAVEVVGAEGEEEDPVFGCGLESGAVVWVKGVGADMDSKVRYEGGADTWAVGCACGARDDDGERMVACENCDVWHHTRCVGIPEGDQVPPMFLCVSCAIYLPMA